MSTYPKDIEGNKRYRLSLLIEADKDREFAKVLMKKCQADILFFINSFLYTYDPRLDKPNLPFITYPFQDEFITELVHCIDTERDNITEKSRDMGFSWMVMSVLLWGFLFKGWTSLIGSYKEDYVDSSGNMDSLFEKIRFMLDLLPGWMKPTDLVSYYQTINSKELKTEIAGDAGENFGTGGRRKVVFMDEFALRANAEKAFRKTKDITNCRIFGGTPEGRMNVYGKIMTNHKDYNHLSIKKFRLHWSQHPKKDQVWYEEQKMTRLKIEVAKELDISYDDSVTGAVYKDFSTICKFGKHSYDPTKKTYTSWDFGRDTNALIFRQKDMRTNTLYVVDSIKRIDRDIRKFASFVTGVPTSGSQYTQEELDLIEYHGKRQYSGHFGDPYNADSRTTNASSSIRDQLQELGIYLQTKRDSTVQERINKVCLSLNRIYIDDDNFDLIQDMIQAKYPQQKENSQSTSEKDKPIHDETSHFRTAFEYFIDNEPIVFNPQQYKRPEKVNPITGKKGGAQEEYNTFDIGFNYSGF